MNVKGPFKGCRLRDKYAFPLTNDENNESYTFLQKFSNWLILWNKQTEKSGKLSKETFTALQHTTDAMLETELGFGRFFLPTVSVFGR